MPAVLVPDLPVDAVEGDTDDAGSALFSPLLRRVGRGRHVLVDSTSRRDPSAGHRRVDPGLQQLADHLWALLDEAEDADAATRHRVLRRALYLAARAGRAVDPSGRDDDEIHDELAWVAQGLALRAHYAAHPEVRPSLDDVTIAFARQRRSPIAEQPEAIRAAVEKARELYGEDVTPRDVFSIAAAITMQ